MLLGHPHPALSEDGILVTAGVLKVGAYWGVDDNGRSLCPSELSQPAAYRYVRTCIYDMLPLSGSRILFCRSSDAISSLGMAGIADLQEVKKWIGLCM